MFGGSGPCCPQTHPAEPEAELGVSQHGEVESVLAGLQVEGLLLAAERAQQPPRPAGQKIHPPVLLRSSCRPSSSPSSARSVSPRSGRPGPHARRRARQSRPAPLRPPRSNQNSSELHRVPRGGETSTAPVRRPAVSIRARGEPRSESPIRSATRSNLDPHTLAAPSLLSKREIH